MRPSRTAIPTRSSGASGSPRPRRSRAIQRGGRTGWETLPGSLLHACGRAREPAAQLSGHRHRVPPDQHDAAAVQRARVRQPSTWRSTSRDRPPLGRAGSGPADLSAPPPGVPGYRPYCPYTRHPTPGGAWTSPDLGRARRLVAASGDAPSARHRLGLDGRRVRSPERGEVRRPGAARLGYRARVRLRVSRLSLAGAGAGVRRHAGDPGRLVRHHGLQLLRAVAVV